MRVQMTEATFGESAPVAAALRAAGHEVTACHGDTGICLALQPGRRCPLDTVASVDLMVDVRGQEPELTAREFGVVCALRDRVPVAVIGADPTVPPAVPAGIASRVTVTTLNELLSPRERSDRVRSHDSRSHRRPLPEEAW
jgi:hypothetical protein